MTIVIDASVTLAWLLGEESESEGIIRRAQREVTVVPSLWLYEIVNGLAVAARRKRITAHDRSGLLALAAQLDVDVDMPAGVVELAEIDAVARKHDLTAYDAAYLLVAKRRDATLATLDGRLRSAAKKEKVALLPA